MYFSSLYVCATCIYRVTRGLTISLDSVEMELQVVANYHVGTGQ